MLNELLEQLAMDKDDPTANTILEARAYMKEYRQEEAIFLCDSLLSSETDVFTRANIMHEKAMIYKFTENYVKAIEEITDAIQELSPDEHYEVIANFRFQRGCFYLELSDAKNAVLDFEQAVKYYPGGKNFDEKLGEAYLMAGEHEPAIMVYSRLIKNEPREEKYWEARAQAHLVSGNISSALSDAFQALSINPDFVDAHIIVAAALDDLNRHEESLPYYARAIQLNTDPVDREILKMGFARALVRAENEKYINDFDLAHDFHDHSPSIN